MAVTMTRQEVAVIGAGPKAAAIAAKAACLRAECIANIGVTVFEKAAVAANWMGASGYTDGDQLLCTPAERDLGFPYDGVFTPGVTRRMLADYSWLSFLAQDPVEFSRWTSAGQRYATHRRFADYLREAFDRSGADVIVDAEVTGLIPQGRQWAVAGVHAGGADLGRAGFDAVVVTGPGPAKRCFGDMTHPALFDGVSFWSNLPAIRGLAGTGEGDIVIVGGGGTAAAVAAWFIRQGFGDRPIRFVCKQPALFTRSEAYFENLVFDDNELWRNTGFVERKNFVDRLTRSVVWQQVTDVLATATDMAVIPGKAIQCRVNTDPGPPLTVVVQPGAPVKGKRDAEADVVVDCTGFDDLWFRRLLPSPYSGWGKDEWDSASLLVDESLNISVGRLPPLHVPSLGYIAGPGFPSLMTLGRMADRILEPYVEASRNAALGSATRPARHP